MTDGDLSVDAKSIVGEDLAKVESILSIAGCTGVIRGQVPSR